MDTYKYHMQVQEDGNQTPAASPAPQMNGKLPADSTSAAEVKAKLASQSSESSLPPATSESLPDVVTKGQ